jgi:hypothetical protein
VVNRQCTHRSRVGLRFFRKDQLEMVWRFPSVLRILRTVNVGKIVPSKAQAINRDQQAQRQVRYPIQSIAVIFLRFPQESTNRFTCFGSRSVETFGNIFKAGDGRERTEVPTLLIRTAKSLHVSLCGSSPEECPRPFCGSALRSRPARWYPAYPLGQRLPDWYSAPHRNHLLKRPHGRRRSARALGAQDFRSRSHFDCGA